MKGQWRGETTVSVLKRRALFDMQGVLGVSVVRVCKGLITSLKLSRFHQVIIQGACLHMCVCMCAHVYIQFISAPALGILFYNCFRAHFHQSILGIKNMYLFVIIIMDFFFLIALFSALKQTQLHSCRMWFWISDCILLWHLKRKIHRSCVLTALFGGYSWLVPHETACISAHILWTPYNHASVYSVVSFEATCVVYMCV